MALSVEWKQKIEYYLQELPKYVMTEVGRAAFEGFVTKERLMPDEAARMPRVPMAENTAWGRKWEYAWLFTKITVPEEAAGKRLVFGSENGECVTFVNGKVYGSFDWSHKAITLAKEAVPGTVYDIVTEVYAGHGKPVQSLGAANALNVPDGKDEPQKNMKDAVVSVWDDEVYGAWLDLKTLYLLARQLPDNSARRAQIEKALKKFAVGIDLEQSMADAAASVREADRELQAALACRNGSTMSAMYAFGHSHLDLEWLWTDNETMRKVARTLGNQLQLLKEYPEYLYLQSQPWLLEVLERDYPELFEEVKQAIEDGSILMEGGMWVESDLNMPSGESLIRQFLYGKKYIKEKFGKESRMLWLPDVFGCSGNLPQIMAGCGIEYFVNAKLPWVYNGGGVFPDTNFRWKGVDGTEILSHMFSNYENQMNADGVYAKWNEHKNKEESPIQLYPFGYGDGGGGCTREHLEMSRRIADLEGMPRVKMASPIDFFEDLEKLNISCVYAGELYYPCHRGTYTSQALTKRLNRKAEYALRNAEITEVLFGEKDEEKYRDDWKKLLFNQFHDIIPGSSIHEVYEKTNRELAEIIADADEKAVLNLKNAGDGKENCLTLFNSLSFDRSVLLTLPAGFTSAALRDGSMLPIQKIGTDCVTEVRVPAMGAVSVVLGVTEVPETVQGAESLILENDLIRAEFNGQGEIVSLIDKESGNETMKGSGNCFRMYRDMPLNCDAWDIDSYYEDQEVEIRQETVISDYYTGSLMSGFTVTKKLNDSVLVQKISLRAGTRELLFESKLDWKETHKLLKVCFDTNLNANELISEIQLGHIHRPANRNDKYEQDRFEVCQHKWSALFEGRRGFAVLNDCKYGVGAVGGKMGISLFKSPKAPDYTADQRVHEFSYAVMLADDLAPVVKAAYALNVPAVKAAGSLDVSSVFTLSSDHVMIDTVKPAEDESGDVIVRLYECANTMTKCTLETALPFSEAVQTNMLEEGNEALEVQNGKILLSFRGMETVTVRLKK